MILNVRGSLGTQVMEYLVGLAQLQITGHELEEIHINTKDTADHSKVDYLSQIFDLGVPVQFVDDTKKVGCFKLENLKQIFLHKEAVFQQLKFRNMHAARCDTVIHYRNGDRQCLSDDLYREIVKRYAYENYFSVGNDYKAMCSIFQKDGIINHLASLGLPAVLDWNSLRHSNHVIGGFSMFSISAHILSPNWIDHKLTVYIDDDNPGISKSDEESLYWLSDNLPIDIVRMKEI